MKTPGNLAPAVRQPAARPEVRPRTLRVAIVGFGTVGSAVARILAAESRALELTHILNRNVDQKRVEWVPETVRWTEQIADILSADVNIVVELIGGLEPAGEWIRRALESGKSVVTANKQLIAHRGRELVRLAEQHGVHLAFGASVAGGIPVICGLEEGLAGDELLQLCGILNGTCNYILTCIESAGVSFEQALAQAQQLGFAEADPREDIDGLDARAKLAILARSALRVSVDHSSILARSISIVERIDFEYAALLGSTIRQVSRAVKTADRLLASVEPMLVDRSSPLASVKGGQNLVMSRGKFGGETVFAGHGAGGNPTAVAVVSDLISIQRRPPSAAVIQAEEIKQLPVSADFSTRHYLRFVVRDEPGIIASLAAILCRAGINIDSVFQKPGFAKDKLPFVITLESCPASLVKLAVDEIAPLPFLVQPCLHLAMLES